jgi:mRNA-degrading endonuclease RelE of RelBE toxin-antitoxin system
MNFNELPEFSKEFKRLSKKYRSLVSDLEEFRRIICVMPLGNSKHFNLIAKNGQCAVIRARLFCRCLKGSSLLRIIYAFHYGSLKVEFIEIYFKGEKENEGRERVKEYLKNQNLTYF